MSRHNTRPEVKALPPWHFPVAETHTLDNGLKVLIYQRPGQHVVSASLAIELPLTVENPADEGVAALTARTLSDGTLSNPGTAFLDAVESCGAGFDAGVSYSATTVFLDVPASRLAAGIDLMAQAVREPALADPDFERNRALRLTEIQHQMASPAQLANLALRRAAIQPKYRSSRLVGGHPATVGTLTGGDTRDFHRRHYHPESATLIVAGDLPNDAGAFIAEAFGSWATGVPGPVGHEHPAPNPPTALLLDRPGSVQADIRLANFTIDRSDPRWADLQVAARILGGVFGSRLNRVLREEKGFTYGVGMGNSPLRHGGITAVQTSVRTDVVGETIALLPGLLDVASRPFTEDEVTSARTFLLGAAPMHYATAAGVSHAVANLVSVGLTADFIDATHAALDSVTPETASQTAIELLPTEHASLVVVGDAEALAPAIRDAGWDVEVVPTDTISDPEPQSRR